MNLGVGQALTPFCSNRIFRWMSASSPFAVRRSFAKGVSSSAGFSPSAVDALHITCFTICPIFLSPFSL